MSLASLFEPTGFASWQDSVVSRELLHKVAHRSGFAISPLHEDAYLLGLRSSYAVAKQVELLPDYIDPRLEIVPTFGGPRQYSKPEPNSNGLSAWCHVFSLRATVPETRLLENRSIALKDTIAVGCIPQTLGTLPSFVSGKSEYQCSQIDATIVRRLLLAGATLTGTTTCENYSFSPMSYTSMSGPVHNPWQQGFNSGGSSSGSAALVALKVARAAGAKNLEGSGPDVELAIGGDQAGSIRVPASYCGIYGLKPTYGLVPYTGIAGLLPMIDHAGPLATNLEDIALLLTVLAGYDGLDERMNPESPLRDNVKQYHDELASFATQTARSKHCSARSGTVEPPLRVGLIIEGFQLPGMSEEVAETVRAAAMEHFTAQGAEVSEVSIPIHSLGAAIWTAAVRNQMASHAFGGRATDSLTHDLPHLTPIWPPNQEMYDVLSRHNPAVILTMLGETMLEDVIPLSAQRKAHRHVLELRAAYDDALGRFDVLITPTTPTVAPPLPDIEDSSSGAADPTSPSTVEKMLRLAVGSTNNTSPFNASGHPALSVPCGWATSTHGGYKLPVGMQIIGRRFDDLGVLKAAKLFDLGGGKLGVRPTGACT
ncbi:amidase [Penicillium riverlandense]|uniref:amidase n=1 Tax=Penicillium riverlandense TaxID=1903569 RepID=UPI0025488B70|nr:amidase [Penicillium riverlandense]KAJ5805363.1 amidase [Penicillium riverlandense]